MQTTPSVNVTADKSEYQGIAQSQMRILKDQMKGSGLEIGSRRVVLKDGTEIVCTKCYRQENIDIILAGKKGNKINKEVVLEETGGFIFHPRTDLYPAGIKSDGTSLGEVQLSAFPLTDSDHGSSALVRINNVPVIPQKLSPGSENYGNISDSKSGVSWRGASGNQIPNADQHIPGFTRDRTDYGDNPLADPDYTPYDNKLYLKGKEYTDTGISTVPGEVLCAAIREGKIWVVVQPLPSSGDQVLYCLIDTVWNEIARRPGYAEVPCIFAGNNIIINNTVGSSGEWTLSGIWSGYVPEELGVLLRGAYWNQTKDAVTTLLYPGVVLEKHGTDITALDDEWERVQGDIVAYGPMGWRVVDWCPPDSESPQGDYRWTAVDAYEVVSSCGSPVSPGCAYADGFVYKTVYVSGKTCDICPGYSGRVITEWDDCGCVAEQGGSIGTICLEASNHCRLSTDNPPSYIYIRTNTTCGTNGYYYNQYVYQPNVGDLATYQVTVYVVEHYGC